MRCKKCNSEVVISDTKCPKCGNDLLKFGSTLFSDSFGKKAHSQTIKNMVFGDLASEIRQATGSLDPWEKKSLLPIENNLKNLFSRRMSDSEIENIFEKEVIPGIDELSKDKATQKIFMKVEEEIKNNLGYGIFDHYKNREEGVLKILRAGEVTCILMKENMKEMDLSVKMFPFFKASEVACWLHIKDRYRELKGSPFVKEIAEWIGNNIDNVFIEGIPQWIVERKKTLPDIMDGILAANEYHLSGSLRTGVSLYVLGRNWILRIERKDISRIKEFQIKNILKAKGNDKDKEFLAENLCELQILRNERVHKGIEDSEKTVQQSRTLSYSCLRKIPEILEI